MRILAGQYFDQETGLYYNWNNYYDPKIGRWITADKMSVAEHVQKWRASLGTPEQLPLELNPYVYTANNPLRWVDPDGLASLAVGAGGGFQYYFWGGSAQSGLAFDTTGNVCTYTTTCKTKAFGNEVDLGPAATISKENLCSGTQESTSYFVSGGKVVYGGGEISKDSVSRGLHGGVGYGAAAGKNMCTTEYHCANVLKFFK